MTAGKRTPPRTIGSDAGELAWWGSECTDCGNATPGSMRCDQCQTSTHTVALWRPA
ncbi:MAG: hypothetical protein QOD63_70 [Actinomycetota bacterium]|jgi:uncharacterized OB-fold protein|nr:hypothetical protein [Actinomycetota bacterium]